MFAKLVRASAAEEEGRLTLQGKGVEECLVIDFYCVTKGSDFRVWLGYLRRWRSRGM